jgi:hypothetical protein
MTSYTTGNCLCLAVKDKWIQSEPARPAHYAIKGLAATEYLADGVGIARWLVRSFQATSGGIRGWTMLGESLRDFDDDERHEDYTLANVGGQPVATPRRVYLGGIGHFKYAAGQGMYTHGRPDRVERAGDGGRTRAGGGHAGRPEHVHGLWRAGGVGGRGGRAVGGE